MTRTRARTVFMRCMAVLASGAVVTGAAGPLSASALAATGAAASPASASAVSVASVDSGFGSDQDPLSGSALGWFGAAAGASAGSSTQGGWFVTPGTNDTTDTTPSYYYMASVAGATCPYPRDASGIIQYKYNWLAYPAYNPTTIASWALVQYDNYLRSVAAGTPDETALADFERHADWLYDHLNKVDGTIPYQWPYPARGLGKPWLSAMAQGMAISVFARSYARSGDTKWLTAAKLAFAPMKRNLTQKGVAAPDSSGYWLEEYPDGTHVLNGAIFAVLGVYDLLRVTDERSPVSTVLKSATATLAQNLHRYERDGAILYQLGGGVNYAFDYEYLHLVQLRTLSALPAIAATSRQVYASTATRWASSFLTHPRLVLTWTKPATIGYGERAILVATIRPLYRPVYVDWSLTSLGVKRQMAPMVVSPGADNVGRLYVSARGVVTNTVATAKMRWESEAAKSVWVGVRARTSLYATPARSSSGRLIRLAVQLSPAQANASVTFERLDGRKGSAFKTVYGVGSRGARVDWPVRAGTYVVRARFLGSAANAPSYSLPAKAIVP